ncbi:MAG TPA: hypothetical protein VFR10_00385 [bacterium]|nr:hypothetical protein [bacterium]
MMNVFRRGRTRWILWVAILIVSTFLYVNTALDLAVARVIPNLLENAQTTETNLVALFRTSIQVAALVVPLLILLVFSTFVWLAVRASAPWTFAQAFDLIARASLFISAGLLVKTLLVVATKNPDPALHLGHWIHGHTPIRAALLALTNPFLLAAIFFTVRGLRCGAVPADRAALTGSAPWIITMILLAISGSHGLVPEVPSITENWPELKGEAITLHHAPGIEAPAHNLFRALDAFAIRLAHKLGITPPQPLTIQLFPNHAALEKAIGEALPIEVTGSIRGAALLDLELPGRNPAVPEARGFADAARYVAILELAPAAQDAPRWFIEGLAHAESFAYSPAIDLAYVSALRRHPASLQTLEDPAVYRTAEGPLLARGLLDFLAYRHGGKETIDGLLRDCMKGTPFRDALFARTRLTMSTLESEWQDSTLSIVKQAPLDSTGGKAGTDAPPSP